MDNAAPPRGTLGPFARRWRTASKIASQQLHSTHIRLRQNLQWVGIFDGSPTDDSPPPAGDRRGSRAGTEIAAVVLEPIMSEGGDREISGHFANGLRKLTLDRGLSLIVDEVRTVGCTHARARTHTHAHAHTRSMLAHTHTHTRTRAHTHSGRMHHATC